MIRFCDELLDAQSFDDWGPNGLQVPGRAEVARVITGVSANLALIERAIDAGADLLITHHGLFWQSSPSALSERMAARLRAALTAGVSIAAYHLPLDAHPEIGNNALLCAGLGLEPSPEPFAITRGRPIGVIGRAREGITAPELGTRVATLTGRVPLVFAEGPDRIRSIGIVSGAASKEIATAIEAGLDAFMTGEPAEHALADAAEGGIHFLAAGHHATETLGVRRLGELVGERFAIEHSFIDVPNPV